MSDNTFCALLAFAEMHISWYSSPMSAKLTEAYKAVQSLPEEAQEAIAFEMLQEVKQYSSGSALTVEQTAIVTDRLSRPFDYASDEEINRVLSKHNIHVRPVA